MWKTWEKLWHSKLVLYLGEQKTKSQLGQGYVRLAVRIKTWSCSLPAKPFYLVYPKPLLKICKFTAYYGNQDAALWSSVKRPGMVLVC